MSMGFTVQIMRTAVFQVLILAAPVLAVSLLVGLVVSIFQATTSIQEQTLTFVPKIVAILLTIGFFGGWMLSSMREYALAIIQLIPDMAK